MAAAALGSVGIVGIAADATLFEPDWLRVKRLEVCLARLSTRLDGFRVAQLSDLHYDALYTAELVEAAVKTTNGLNPDLRRGNIQPAGRTCWDDLYYGHDLPNFGKHHSRGTKAN